MVYKTEGHPLEDEPKEPIKVLDRRHFTSEGNRRPDVPPLQDEGRPAESAEASASAPSEKPADAAETGPQEPPSIFSEFVLSLASSCFMSLGQIPSPVTGRPDMDLESAGSMIDILEALQTKTQGNLDAQEQDLLDRTLYQLKLLYVKARQTGQQ
jgi:hypothetical protein